jgi:hypothetical protein
MLYFGSISGKKTDMLEIHGLAQHITPALTPILIMNGALLAMISVRNQHLSERSRANITENFHTLHDNRISRDEAIVKKRSDSLIAQHKWFLWRYVLTSAAFVIMTISLILFGVSGAYQSDWWGTVASVFFASGSVLLIVEFCLGPVTLHMNAQSILPDKHKGDLWMQKRQES